MTNFVITTKKVFSYCQNALFCLESSKNEYFKLDKRGDFIKALKKQGFKAGEPSRFRLSSE